ncbi:PucR family transcriptional regulator [Streptomyces lasiicapitis]|uniref:PucR family transcriptional regulator n=1 Tax=Streptomyces lasiicapitis TaxID=1923961 RepID=UPI00364966F8
MALYEAWGGGGRQGGDDRAGEGDLLPVLSPAARALAARCEPRVNELARRMAREAFERLPGYAGLPADVKDVEIAATARHGLRLFLDRVAGGRPPVPAGYDLFRERAAQRADEGMPLHLLLGTHCLGAHVLWRALRDAAGPADATALTELSDHLFAAQRRVVTAVTETYLDEQAAIAAERREERRTLARALLDGTPAPSADAAGFAGPVLVLCLRLDEGPRPGTSAGPVAVRRLVRRLQSALDRGFGTQVLMLVEGGGGHVLVPGERDLPELDLLVGELRELCGAGLRLAAATVAEPARIPEAARTTEEIIRVARACGRPPGAHVLDDVLLEYHLSRPSAGSARIAALLEPVAERPELLDTLRTYLKLRQDRRATGRLLSLHPNTVDNRLARVSALTGLDLTASHGTALALAALLLRDLE